MTKRTRFFAIIAALAAIGFSTAGCDNGASPGGGGAIPTFTVSFYSAGGSAVAEQTVAEQEHGILNAMAEQSAGSTQIMQAIAQVNDITGQVKEDAQQMVEAAAKLGV